MLIKQVKATTVRISQSNWLLYGLVYSCIAFGVIFLYGTDQHYGDANSRFWARQMLWICLGSLPMLILAAWDYRKLGPYAWVFFLLNLALLILVMIIGKRINGAKSWLPIAGGFSLQPSEFAKLAVIFMVSWYASRSYVRMDRLSGLGLCLVIMMVPFALILLQPDLGSAMVLLPICIAILFVSGLSIRWMVYGLIVAIFMAPLIYKFGLKEHQQKRLTTFLHPTSNPTKEGWNARQSLLAVGSGGYAGKGFMKGTQNVLGFLPKSVAPTDFIFSVIAEESGFIGSLVLISLFLGIMLNALYIAIKAGDAFGRNLACGIAMLLCVHIYINIGMAIGLAPIIGIPLPFVSYGGSFMIMTLLCVGLLQSVYRYRRIY